MTISFVASGTFVQSKTSTTGTPGLPTGLATGDVMVATVAAFTPSGSTTSPTPPTGWTLISQQRAVIASNPIYQLYYAMWYRVAVSGETAASWTFPSDFITDPRNWGITIKAWRGVLTPTLSSNITATSISSSPSGAFTPTAPTLTAAGRMVCGFMTNASGISPLSTANSYSFVGGGPTSSFTTMASNHATRDITSGGTAPVPTFSVASGSALLSINFALRASPDPGGGLRLGKLHLNAARGLS